MELIKMNSSLIMCEYIEFCADRLLRAIGCGCHYKVGNPFEWMETISLQGRVGEYAKSGDGVDCADQNFALDTIF
jgi:ribonucleoside-diphosphate reductase subunit M2